MLKVLKPLSPTEALPSQKQPISEHHVVKPLGPFRHVIIKDCGVRYLLGCKMRREDVSRRHVLFRYFSPHAPLK